MTYKYKLELNNILYKVKLGYKEEERSIPQEIFISIAIHFAKAPNACFNDNLADTFCYDTLCNKIKDFLYGKEFKLIENLGHKIFHFIKQDVHENISLTIHKNPSILPILQGGAHFTISD